MSSPQPDPTSPYDPSAFGQPTPPAAPDAYGQPMTDPYGQPPVAPGFYGQPAPTTPPNPYGQPASAAPSNPYGQPAPDQTFGQTAFPPTPAAYPPAAPYGQPGAPSYGQPYPSTPFGAVTNSTKGNPMGLIALICGVVAILCLVLSDVTNGNSFISILWLLTSIAAIVFGALGIKAAGRGEATNKPMAIGGMVVGIIMCALFLIVILIVGAILGSML